MLSEFRRRKLSAGFAQLDVDGDGRLGADDVEKLIENHGDAYGFAEGTPEYEELAARTRVVWEQLRRFDTDGDGQVSLDEYVAGFEQFLDRREEFMETMAALVDSFYRLADRDGSGQLTEDELIRHYRSWNHTEEQAREAFGRLDRNGRGAISRDEWMANLEEFYFSEDPDVPGTWLAPLPGE
jgi:Ca2+-binding EF-hand superfamily protein